MAERNQRSRRRRMGLSRREFLAGSAAAGMALGLPGWLAGCGDGNDGGGPPVSETPTPKPGPAPGPREQRTLNFDLSFAPVSEPRLRVLLSSDDGMPLTPHTAETRARFRARDPLLRGVSDAQLTHFARDVNLPAASMQNFWITGLDASGGPAFLGMQVHVPREVRRAQAAAARASGASRLYSAKMRAYGLEAVADDLTLEDLAPALDEFQTPWDTASALVFHQPEIMNLNLDQGPMIRDLIETLPCSPANRDCLPFLSTLAFHIANNWPATTTPGGWATLLPMLDPETGDPILDEDGGPLYRTVPTDETIAAAQMTMRNVLSVIFNDPRFAGSNWHELRGRTLQAARSTVSGPIRASGFELVPEHAIGTFVNGVEFTELRVDDAAARKLTLRVKNYFLRSLSVHLQFANQGGPLPVSDADDLDSTRAKFATVVVTNDTLLGIPLVGPLLHPQDVSIEVPAEASQVTVYFGSLGLGGDPFCPEAVLGTVWTLIFNIAIPVIALALGVAAELSDGAAKFLDQVFRNRKSPLSIVLQRVIRRGLLSGAPGLGRGIFGAAASNDAVAFVAGLGDLLVQLLAQLPSLLTVVFKDKIAETAVSAALSNASVASKLLAAGPVLLELAQTVGEVLASPALFTNTLSLVMTTTVRIEHDPDDFRFPARARRYHVTLLYDQASKSAHREVGDISPGRVDPISVVFDKVPSGGMVTVDVVLLTAEGYIIGRSVDPTSGKEGPIGPIPNTPTQAGTIVVEIKERLIALTQSTRYRHDLELGVEGVGQRVWREGPAPTDTRAGLCQGQDDRLCTLGGITINQRTGMAGYSFSAGGQDGRLYCGESAGGVMHLFQNVFLGEGPDSGLKTLPCGFRNPAGIVYDRSGPAAGRHFFLEPAPDGQSFFLESVVLDNTTPFGLNNPVAWGRFTQALEALAVVPTGYVVGVSRLTHKMEILQLPAAAVDRADAPEAVPFAVLKCGEGTREGLLSAPVAVAVRDATILVLETGNARIQAFDVSANPVLAFKNGSSATVELEKQAGLEYLDLAVEGLGYMYVLSAANGGLMVDDYRLDIFTPQGNLLARTTGVAAARLAVDTFRNVYTLNFDAMLVGSRIEPRLSQWVPLG